MYVVQDLPRTVMCAVSRRNNAGDAYRVWNARFRRFAIVLCAFAFSCAPCAPASTTVADEGASGEEVGRNQSAGAAKVRRGVAAIEAYEPPPLNELPDGLRKPVSRIRDFRAERGIAPSMDEFFAVIAEFPLTTLEQPILYWEMMVLQNPVISLEELRATTRAKRDSITSFKCEYSLEMGNKSSAHLYAFDRNKIRVLRGL